MIQFKKNWQKEFSPRAMRARADREWREKDILHHLSLWRDHGALEDKHAIIDLLNGHLL